jgi:hypothetical protein
MVENNNKHTSPHLECYIEKTMPLMENSDECQS